MTTHLVSTYNGMIYKCTDIMEPARKAVAKARLTFRAALIDRQHSATDQKGDQKQHHGDRAGVAHAVLIECLLVHVSRHQLRRSIGPAPGHHPDQVEVFERADQ